VVGVNGTGKTTTIGKLAMRFQGKGMPVMLAAADTFRAAAIEQLEIWSKRANVPLIKQKMDSDPSAVVYDAVHAAQAGKADVVIIDTAGRLHTKVNLMEELKKMKRILARELPGAPHEVLLVLDATTGQNALTQAKMFAEEIGVTGLVLTKLDGTSKGGVIIRIAHELHLPIRYIGIGEGIEDLRRFKSEEFIDALFEQNG
jgi:fused signal recognition particle receptor